MVGSGSEKFNLFVWFHKNKLKRSPNIEYWNYNVKYLFKYSFQTESAKNFFRLSSWKCLSGWFGREENPETVLLAGQNAALTENSAILDSVVSRVATDPIFFENADPVPNIKFKALK